MSTTVFSENLILPKKNIRTGKKKHRQNDILLPQSGALEKNKPCGKKSFYLK